MLREWLPSGTAVVRLNIDATHRGNLARFFNHACDGGNLQLLLGRRGMACNRLCCGAAARRELQWWTAPCCPLPPPQLAHAQDSRPMPCRRRTGSLLPRVVFVTSRPVAAGEELTYAYGPPNAGPDGRPCACGTAACRGFMPHEEV